MLCVWFDIKYVIYHKVSRHFWKILTESTIPVVVKKNMGLLNWSIRKTCYMTLQNTYTMKYLAIIKDVLSLFILSPTPSILLCRIITFLEIYKYNFLDRKCYINIELIKNCFFLKSITSKTKNSLARVINNLFVRWDRNKNWKKLFDWICNTSLSVNYLLYVVTKYTRTFFLTLNIHAYMCGINVYETNGG